MRLHSHVVICGHSLYLDAIAATLRSTSSLMVTQLRERSGMVERAVALGPDALIVERDAVDESLLHTLSARLVGVPVFELHNLQSVLTIHTTQEIPVLDLSQLTQMLEHLVPLTKLPRICDKTQMLEVGS
ncbi:MAG: hypothetical protein JXR84_16200 [Anaerolineae bacterium]|nr:hypothetical protein [Anaerolineae bacterium]